MVAEVGFYHLTKTALEPALGRLLTKVLASGQRAVVKASSEERVEALNRALWTFETDSFLPHGSAKDGHSEQQPIFLTTKADLPNDASILVLVDGAAAELEPPVERVLIMFDGQDQAALGNARSAWKTHQERGDKLVYWQQTERGGWKKAREA